MKLSRETVSALKTISAITDSIQINPGNVLLAKNASNSVVVRHVVPDQFPVTVPIWNNLKNTLALVDLFDDPEFEFNRSDMTISAGRYKQKISYSDPDLIPKPKKDPVEHQFDWLLVVDVSEVDFKTMLKAAAINSSKSLVFESAANANVFMRLTDSNGKDSNGFVVDTGIVSPKPVNIVISLDNVKKLDTGAYSVKIATAPQPIAEWTHDNTVLKYYVVLEKETAIG